MPRGPEGVAAADAGVHQKAAAVALLVQDGSRVAESLLGDGRVCALRRDTLRADTQTDLGSLLGSTRGKN